MIENEKIVTEVKEFLEIDQDEDLDFQSYQHYGLPVVSVGSAEYAIAEDYDSAVEAANQYIQDSLWAFTPSFLESMTGVPQEAFEACADNCESNNDWILRLVEKTCGLEKLCEKAIREDGLGHFLSSYDGNFEELNCGAIVIRVN